MKRPNDLIGLIGGLILAVASGLAMGKMYILAAITFILGLAIVDWNRDGN